jgi:type IV pilus assembly protein PilA
MRISTKEAGFTLVELMIVVAILGIVSALAIPNFIRYQAQSRQSEARTSLSAIFVSETAYYGEQSVFGTFDQIGYALAGTTNRYAYRVGLGTTVNVDLLPPGVGFDPGQNLIVASGLTAVPVPGFTATATANLDGDLVIDMWHVNDIKLDLQNADRNDAR